MSQTISGEFRDFGPGYADYIIKSNKDLLRVQVNNNKPGSGSGISFVNSRKSNPADFIEATIDFGGNEQLYINAPDNITFRAFGGGDNKGRLYVWDDSKVSDKANVKLDLLGSLHLRPQTGSVSTDNGTIYVDVDGNLYAFSGGKKHTLTGLDQVKKDQDQVKKDVDQVKKDLEAKSKSDNLKLVAVVVLVLVLSGACVYMCKK